MELEFALPEISTPLSESPLARPKLTPPQKQALASLQAQRKRFGKALLQGVPGAGKTEVYLQLAADSLAKKKQVLILVPEIALTAQLKARIEKCLGQPVALFHSYLSPRERAELFFQASRGTAKLILGARSALFLDIPELDLIVVDEEQEPSFKNEQGIRYHARDVALAKAESAGAFCLFVTATPSCEIYYEASRGKMGWTRLTERYGAAQEPVIQLLDLRHLKKEGPISQELLTHIAACARRREQVVLLYNRRGFAPYCICHFCGSPVRCQNCDVSLVYHRFSRLFCCHHCGAVQKELTHCPTCQSPYLEMAGFGTEKVEEWLHKKLPEVSLARLDLDTVSQVPPDQLLSQVEAQKITLLVGTQMVAKGLDIENVTLAAVLSFEHALHLPDFRAEERCFQLLVQLAGRAGRREKQGEVFIQTYQPDLPLLEKVKRFAVEEFLEEELKARERAYFPPYCRLLRIEIAHPKKEKVEALAEKVIQFYQLSEPKKVLPKPSGKVEVTRPIPSPIFKERGKFRYHFFLKASPKDLLVEEASSFLQEFSRFSHSLTLDFEPYRML